MRAESHAVSLTFRNIAQGDRIRIVRAFEDFDGQRIEVGRELELAGVSTFPYDAGFTLTFVGGVVIRLSGNYADQREVLDNAGDAYFVRIAR
jgi:hypothetical protein